MLTPLMDSPFPGLAMTWVLGANTEFGSVLMASDIRITLRGCEYDCLQKVYPLGFNIVGGFSGSVTIGMDTLAFLSAQFANAPPGAKPEKVNPFRGWHRGVLGGG